MPPVTYRTLLVLAVLLLVHACAPRSGMVPAYEDSPAAAPGLTCREVDGLEPLLAPGAGVLLGEIHGTAESPAFVANAACLALRAGRPVTVALEIPREEQSRVDTFLASAGSAADRAALLDSSFWTDAYQDGRRSEAMVALLDELRRLHGGGQPVRVKPIDRSERPSAPMERDRWMGEALAQAFEETPGGVVIALAGNLHTRVRRGNPFNPDYVPAGLVLVERKPDLRITALDVVYPAGTAWICTSAEASSCEARPMRGQGDGRGDRVVLHPEVTNGYHGVYHVTSLTASPPAKPSPPAPLPQAGEGSKAKT